MKSALFHRKDQEILERINRLFHRKNYKLLSQALNHDQGLFHFRAAKPKFLPIGATEGLDLKICRESEGITRVEISVLRNGKEVDHPSYRDKEEHLVDTMYKIF
ncbi:MAG: hypothetical protein RL213_1042 [Bacteroidota bacterium]|jgi:hypothetical protein